MQDTIRINKKKNRKKFFTEKHFNPNVVAVSRHPVQNIEDSLEVCDWRRALPRPLQLEPIVVGSLGLGLEHNLAGLPCVR